MKDIEINTSYINNIIVQKDIFQTIGKANQLMKMVKSCDETKKVYDELLKSFSYEVASKLYPDYITGYETCLTDIATIQGQISNKYDIIFKDLSTMELVEYTESSNTDEILCIVPKEYTKAERKKIIKQLSKV